MAKKSTKTKTHMITLVSEKGRKRVKVHETATSWVVGVNEGYCKQTGRRNACPTSYRRLLIDTVTEIVVLEPLRVCA